MGCWIVEVGKTGTWNRQLSKTIRGGGALEFAKRGWRTEVAVAACTVASESKRVTSPSVLSH